MPQRVDRQPPQIDTDFKPCVVIPDVLTTVMPREDRATLEPNYLLKIIQLLDDYPECFIAEADSVGSKPISRST